MMAEGSVAAIARARRSASAASSALRESKRRVVRFVMPCPSAAAWALPHLGVHLEHVPAAQPAQQHAAAGRMAGDATERILSTVRRTAVDAEQQIAGLQPRA